MSRARSWLVVVVGLCWLSWQEFEGRLLCGHRWWQRGACSCEWCQVIREEDQGVSWWRQ